MVEIWITGCSLAGHAYKVGKRSLGGVREQELSNGKEQRGRSCSLASRNAADRCPAEINCLVS